MHSHLKIPTRKDLFEKDKTLLCFTVSFLIAFNLWNFRLLTIQLMRDPEHNGEIRRAPSEIMKFNQIIYFIVIASSPFSLDVVHTKQIATQPEGSFSLTMNAEWVRNIY